MVRYKNLDRRHSNKNKVRHSTFKLIIYEQISYYAQKQKTAQTKKKQKVYLKKIDK